MTTVMMRIKPKLARPGLVLMVLAAFALAPASAADTHLGVPLRDMVTLEMRSGVKGGCGEERLDFLRVFPDGKSDAAVFRVPQDRALVVTDLDWYYFQGTPGLMVVLSVLVENLAEPSKRHRAAESAVRLGPDGVGGASEHMTSGFVVSSESRLCVEVVNSPVGSPLRLSKVLLRGYLVDQR